MKGTIQVFGSVYIKAVGEGMIKAGEGIGGAGIGGGSYLDYSGGDMRGKIIFNCTPDSWIEATGGHNFNAPYKSGAAIGGGSTQEWARDHQIPFIRE